MAEYEEAVYLIVEDSFDASSQSPTLPEVAKRTKAWARLLFGIVPEEHLQESFDLAFDVHDSVFPVNAYEIKNAFIRYILPRLEKEQAKIEAEKQKTNRVENCRNKDRHINADGDVLCCSPLNFNDEISLPCPVCQPKAFDTEREMFIAKNKSKDTVEKKVLGLVKTVVKPMEKPMVFAEEVLSPEKIAELQSEHNKLVCEIVTDGSEKNLIVVYNESVNMFKHPQSMVPLYSFKDIREKILSYKRILEEREV